jgi:hypothetical protein
LVYINMANKDMKPPTLATNQPVGGIAPMTTNVKGGEVTVTIPINAGIRGLIMAAENSKKKQRRSRPTPSITLGHMTRLPSTNP